MSLQKRKFAPFVCLFVECEGLWLILWGISRGLFAIKDYRDSINQDDFNKAVRKMAESKKLEGKLDYQKL